MIITIRTLTPEDFPSFENVFTKSIRHDYNEWSKKIKDFFTSHKQIQKEFDQPFRYGAFEGDKLVGYLILMEPDGGVIYLRLLGVIPSYQRQGIGKQLLAKADEIAIDHGCHAIHLEADKKQVPYYETQGYIQFGFEEKGDYGTDNYHLTKHVAEPDENKFT